MSDNLPGRPPPPDESAAVVVTLPPREARRDARLTVVDSVYHAAGKGEPTVAAHKFMRVLVGDEQPFTRWSKAIPEWTALETGWLTTASMMVLVNEEGPQNFQVRLSEEQKAEIAARVIEVGVKPVVPAGRTMHSPPICRDVIPAFRVRPGESCRVEPAELGSLFLRCTGGVARYKLVLLPE